MNVYNFYYLRDTVPGDMNIIANNFETAVTRFKTKAEEFGVKTGRLGNVEICAVKIIVADLDLSGAWA